MLLRGKAEGVDAVDEEVDAEAEVGVVVVDQEVVGISSSRVVLWDELFKLRRVPLSCREMQGHGRRIWFGECALHAPHGNAMILIKIGECSNEKYMIKCRKLQ